MCSFRAPGNYPTYEWLKRAYKITSGNKNKHTTQVNFNASFRNSEIIATKLLPLRETRGGVWSS